MSSSGEGDLQRQIIFVTVEEVLTSGNGTRGGVLPESIGVPSSRQSANAVGIVGDPQRAGGTESSVVTGASLPPISVGVDHRVAIDTGTILVGEIANPANHGSGAQAIASSTAWVIYPINNGRSVSGSWMLKMYDPYS